MLRVLDREPDRRRNVEGEGDPGAGLRQLAGGEAQGEQFVAAHRWGEGDHHLAVADRGECCFEAGEQAETRVAVLAHAAAVEHRRPGYSSRDVGVEQAFDRTGIGEDGDDQALGDLGHARQVARDGSRGNVAAVRRDLLGLTCGEFTAWSRGLVGHAERFHGDLYRRLMASGRFAPAESPLWREAEATRPGTIATLATAAAEDQLPAITDTLAAHDDELGSTTKVLCRLADGCAVESVLIPMRAAGHHTVCLSSQVGCKMGCSFCHTAKMGLVRSLTAHEIVAQAVAVHRATGTAPRNAVFMGMGEPLDNAEAVAQAVRVLTDGAGLALRHRHITISTVGRVDGLERWQALGLGRTNLAVSLTAADDALRSELMPVNRLYPLERLKRALQAIPVPADRRILISCVVIPGITDAPAHTDALVDWLSGLPVLVNLIPFNPIPSRTWGAPSEAEVLAVRERIERAGIPVRLRLTKGDAVMAACGQLGDPPGRRSPQLGVADPVNAR